MASPWGAIQCGLHSGIPFCCVRWYVQVWGPARAETPWPPWTDLHWAAQRRLEQEELGRMVQYVMCPDCLELGVPAAEAVPYDCTCRYPLLREMPGIWAPLVPEVVRDMAYSGRA